MCDPQSRTLDYTSIDNLARSLTIVQLTFFTIIRKDPRGIRPVPLIHWFRRDRSLRDAKLRNHRPRGMQAEESWLWCIDAVVVVVAGSLSNSGSKSRPRLPEETPRFLPLTLLCVSRRLFFSGFPRERAYLFHAPARHRSAFFFARGVARIFYRI